MLQDANYVHARQGQDQLYTHRVYWSEHDCYLETEQVSNYV